jgi:phosphatidate cytidylyltransferase
MSLKVRTFTGVIFGLVMIGGILANYYTCGILFWMVAALCLWELSGHVLTQDGSTWANRNRRVISILVGLFFPTLTLLTFIFDVQNAFKGIVLFPAIAFLLFLFELTAKSAKPFENVAFTLLGIIYIGMPFSLLIYIASPYLRAFDGDGNKFVLATILMVWAGDVFAYLIGSKVGKNKMFPRISPKKTWEGTFSGITGAILVGVICSQVFDTLDFGFPFWIGLASICTVMGVLGDLVESMLKRSIGIKDSGTLLPGHGGFLDRFDAFIFVIPFVYVYVTIWFYFL